MAHRHDTSGHKAWWEMKSFEGRDDYGNNIGSECFRNIVTGETVVPDKGWNGEPPRPSGDLACARHAGDAYREGWERTFGSKND